MLNKQLRQDLFNYLIKTTWWACAFGVASLTHLKETYKTWGPDLEWMDDFYSFELDHKFKLLRDLKQVGGPYFTLAFIIEHHDSTGKSMDEAIHITLNMNLQIIDCLKGEGIFHPMHQEGVRKIQEKYPWLKKPVS